MDCDASLLFIIYKNLIYKLAELKAITPGILKFSTSEIVDEVSKHIKVDYKKDLQSVLSPILNEICIREFKIEESNGVIVVTIYRDSCPFVYPQIELEEEYCVVPFILVEMLRKNGKRNAYLLHQENSKFINCKENACIFKIMVKE